MALAGFNLTSQPQPGDVAVVRTPVGQIVAGIRVGPGWAMKTERGIGVAEVPMLCAWSLARG